MLNKLTRFIALSLCALFLFVDTAGRNLSLSYISPRSGFARPSSEGFSIDQSIESASSRSDAKSGSQGSVVDFGGSSIENSLESERSILSLRASDQINRYKIKRKIGQGGMAAVYEAYDQLNDRTVAIKIVRTEYVSSRALDRFAREARIAANIDHPNVIHVLDYGTGQGFFYYTMEMMVEGDLKAKRGKVEVAKGVEYVVQALKGLEYIHIQGVVHRDLKPSNILLRKDQAVLADFGLARSDEDVTRTRTQAVFGTPSYMSPEQVRGDSKGVSYRSDIFSMGVVLYNLLTGELPFGTGKDFESLKTNVLGKDLIRPESIPEPLWKIINKALQKAPSSRFQTAGEFYSALESFLNGEEVDIEIAEPRKKKKSRWKITRLLSRKSDNEVQEGQEEAARPYLEKGIELINQGMDAEAEKVLEQALVKAPDLFEVHYYLGLSYASLLREKALASFSRAIDLNSNSYLSYFERGRHHLQLKNYDLALEDFKRVIAIRPQFAEAYKYMAAAYRSLNQPIKGGYADLKSSQIKQSIAALTPKGAPTALLSEGVAVSLTLQNSGVDLERARQVLEATPQKIGRYEVLEKIGQGGMGLVYRARDPELNREVAIKLLPRFESESSQERFGQEIEVLKRLEERAIVRFYEVGETGGRQFYVMEYVEAQNLQEWFKQEEEALEPKQAVRFVRDVAEVMNRVHQQGVVHADLKPSNIIGTLSKFKIADFGLARFTEEIGFDESQVAGTPAYMSPEQARGELPTALSDIYSLGVILYEFLAGRRPVQANSIDELLRKVRAGEYPPVNEANPKLNKDIVAVVKKAMALDPNKRYQNMNALFEDLNRYLAGEAVLAKPEGKWARGARWLKKAFVPETEEEKQQRRERATPFVEAGLSYLEQNNLNAAEKEFEEALEHDPDSIEALLSLGRTYSQQRKKPQRVLKHLNRAIKLSPNSSSALVIRGQFHLRRRDYQLALQDFKAASRKEPILSEAYIGLGLTYLLLTEYDSFKMSLYNSPRSSGSNEELDVSFFSKAITLLQLARTSDGTIVADILSKKVLMQESDMTWPGESSLNISSLSKNVLLSVFLESNWFPVDLAFFPMLRSLGKELTLEELVQLFKAKKDVNSKVAVLHHLQERGIYPHDFIYELLFDSEGAIQDKAFEMALTGSLFVEKEIREKLIQTLRDNPEDESVLEVLTRVVEANTVNSIRESLLIESTQEPSKYSYVEHLFYVLFSAEDQEKIEPYVQRLIQKNPQGLEQVLTASLWGNEEGVFTSLNFLRMMNAQKNVREKKTTKAILNLALTESNSTQVRGAAIQLLNYLSKPKGRQSFFEKSFNMPRPLEEEIGMIQILAEGITEVLVEALEKKMNQEQRLQLVQLLGQARNEVAMKALVKISLDPEEMESVRLKASHGLQANRYGLNYYTSSEAFEPFYDLLKEKVKEGDDAFILSILNTIIVDDINRATRLYDHRFRLAYLTQIEDLTTHLNKNISMAALLIKGEFDSNIENENSELFIRLVRDEDPKIREAAYLALGKSEKLSSLLENISNEMNPEVLVGARRVLVNMEMELQIWPFITVLLDASQPKKVRIAASRIIEAYQEDKEIDSILNALRFRYSDEERYAVFSTDSDLARVIRLAAKESLQIMADKTDKEWIADLVSDLFNYNHHYFEEKTLDNSAGEDLAIAVEGALQGWMSDQNRKRVVAAFSEKIRGNHHVTAAALLLGSLRRTAHSNIDFNPVVYKVRKDDLDREIDSTLFEVFDETEDSLVRAAIVKALFNFGSKDELIERYKEKLRRQFKQKNVAEWTRLSEYNLEEFGDDESGAEFIVRTVEPVDRESVALLTRALKVLKDDFDKLEEIEGLYGGSNYAGTIRKSDGTEQTEYEAEVAAYASALMYGDDPIEEEEESLQENFDDFISGIDSPREFLDALDDTLAISVLYKASKSSFPGYFPNFDDPKGYEGRLREIEKAIQAEATKMASPVDLEADSQQLFSLLEVFPKIGRVLGKTRIRQLQTKLTWRDYVAESSNNYWLAQLDERYDLEEIRVAALILAERNESRALPKILALLLDSQKASIQSDLVTAARYLNSDPFIDRLLQLISESDRRDRRTTIIGNIRASLKQGRADLLPNLVTTKVFSNELDSVVLETRTKILIEYAKIEKKWALIPLIEAFRKTKENSRYFSDPQKLRFSTLLKESLSSGPVQPIQSLSELIGENKLTDLPPLLRGAVIQLLYSLGQENLLSAVYREKLGEGAPYQMVSIDSSSLELKEERVAGIFQELDALLPDQVSTQRDFDLAKSVLLFAGAIKVGSGDEDGSVFFASNWRGGWKNGTLLEQELYGMLVDVDGGDVDRYALDFSSEFLESVGLEEFVPRKEYSLPSSLIDFFKAVEDQEALDVLSLSEFERASKEGKATQPPSAGELSQRVREAVKPFKKEWVKALIDQIEEEEPEEVVIEGTLSGDVQTEVVTEDVSSVYFEKKVSGVTEKERQAKELLELIQAEVEKVEESKDNVLNLAKQIKSKQKDLEGAESVYQEARASGLEFVAVRDGVRRKIEALKELAEEEDSSLIALAIESVELTSQRIGLMTDQTHTAYEEVKAGRIAAGTVAKRRPIEEMISERAAQLRESEDVGKRLAALRERMAAPEEEEEPSWDDEGSRGERALDLNLAVGKGVYNVASHKEINLLIRQFFNDPELFDAVLKVNLRDSYFRNKLSKSIQNFIQEAMKELAVKSLDRFGFDEMRMLSIFQETEFFFLGYQPGKKEQPTLLMADSPEHYQVAHAGTGGTRLVGEAQETEQRKNQQIYISYGLLQKLMAAKDVEAAGALFWREARLAYQRQQNRISNKTPTSSKEDLEVRKILRLLEPYIREDIETSRSVESVLYGSEPIDIFPPALTVERYL